MKLNKIFLMLAMLILCVSLASAFTTNIASPITTQGATINFTTDVSAGYGKLANCSLSLASTVTANTSVTLLTQQENTSGNIDFVNLSYTSTDNLQDGLYTITATCWNDSDDSASDTQTFSVDNTLPTAPSSLTSTAQTSNAFTLTATLNDASTTDCDIDWDSGSPLDGLEGDTTCTYATTSCSCAVTNAPEWNHKYRIYATDGINRTYSSEVTFNIDTTKGKSSGGARATTTTQKPLSITETVTTQSEQAKSRLNTIISTLVSWFTRLFS